MLWNGLINHSHHYLIYFFNHFSGKCCNSVRAWYLKDEQNNSWDNHEEKFGNYKLQEGTVNRKAHYISTDGKSAIWYSPKGRWSGFDVYLVNVKSSGRLFQIFVAFSKCPNFKKVPCIHNSQNRGDFLNAWYFFSLCE